MGGDVKMLFFVHLIFLGFLNDKLLPIIIQILQSPIVKLPDSLLVYHLLIIIIILVCIVILIKQISIPSVKKTKAKFFKYQDLKWKYFVNRKGKLIVEETPYCIDHNVKMLETHITDTESYPVLHCPICNTKFPENKMEYSFDLLHESVKNILESKK